MSALVDDRDDLVYTEDWCCGATCVGGPPYVCTLDSGHEGPHIAHGQRHEEIARWSDDGDVVEQPLADDETGGAA